MVIVLHVIFSIMTCFDLPFSPENPIFQLIVKFRIYMEGLFRTEGNYALLLNVSDKTEYNLD